MSKAFVVLGLVLAVSTQPALAGKAGVDCCCAEGEGKGRTAFWSCSGDACGTRGVQKILSADWQSRLSALCTMSQGGIACRPPPNKGCRRAVPGTI